MGIMKRETIADLDFNGIVGAVRYKKENRDAILGLLGCDDPVKTMFFPRHDIMQRNGKNFTIIFDTDGSIHSIGFKYDNDRIKVEEGQWIAKTIFDGFFILNPIPEGTVEEGPHGIPKHILPLNHIKEMNMDISDGYHTFGELYRYLMLYNALFFNELAKQGTIKVCKSHKHHDGIKPFSGGWFIVQAELPTGQISKHYENKYWDLFRIPELETAWEWDGHSANEAADRIEAYLKIKGTIVMQFYKDRGDELLELMDPDGMESGLLMIGDKITKVDSRNFTFNYDVDDHKAEVKSLEYRYPDGVTRKVEEGSWIARSDDGLFYVLELDSPMKTQEESNQPKDHCYMSCVKFDRYGGKDVFEMLGFENVSLTENTENDHAIITPIPSERAFGLKLKTPEGLVEVDNGDFIFKDDEGNFSVSEYPPITVVGSNDTLVIVKGVDENPLINPDQSTPNNLVDSTKNKIPLENNNRPMPMYCGFKMSKEEWMKKEAEEANKNYFGDKYDEWKKVCMIREEGPLYSFSSAISWIKKGMVVTRGSWINKVVFRQVPAVIGANIIPKMQSLPDAAKAVILRTGGISYDSQCLIYNTHTGVADSWCPTIGDVMAEDWKLYKTEEEEEEK